MNEGTVMRLVIDRGFGFIARSGEPDLFFHVKDCDPSLPFDEGLMERRVRFNVVSSPKGPRAVGVRAAD